MLRHPVFNSQKVVQVCQEKIQNTLPIGVCKGIGNPARIETPFRIPKCGTRPYIPHRRHPGVPRVCSLGEEKNPERISPAPFPLPACLSLFFPRRPVPAAPAQSDGTSWLISSLSHQYFLKKKEMMGFCVDSDLKKRAIPHDEGKYWYYWIRFSFNSLYSWDRLVDAGDIP